MLLYAIQQMSRCTAMRYFSAKPHAIPLETSKVVHELCAGYVSSATGTKEPEPHEMARRFVAAAHLLENYFVLRNRQETKNMLFKFRFIDPDRPDRNFIREKHDDEEAADKCNVDEHYLKEILFLNEFAFILKLGGYEEVQREAVEKRLKYHRRYGKFDLEVQPSNYKFVRFWVSGRKEMDEEFIKTSSVWEPWQSEDKLGVLHERVIVASRSKKSSNMILKEFKDIPELHFEALLPEARIRIPAFRRWILNTVVAFPGLICFFDMYLPIVTDFKFNLLLIFTIFCGFLSYRYHIVYDARVKDSILQWKRMLYYKSTANNAGLVLHSINRKRERSLNQALILYGIALQLSKTRKLVTEEEVAKRACEWLSSFNKRKIEEEDLNLCSSFSFLRRLGLIALDNVSEKRGVTYSLIHVLEPLDAVETLQLVINEISTGKLEL